MLVTVQQGPVGPVQSCCPPPLTNDGVFFNSTVEEIQSLDLGIKKSTAGEGRCYTYAFVKPAYRAVGTEETFPRTLL